MKIKNSEIMSPRFWKSFNTLMEVKEMKVEDKMNLARLKRDLANEIEVIKDSCVPEESVDSELVKSIMQQNADFDYSFNFTADGLAVHLTPEDLFQLEPLLNKEN